MNFNKEKRLTDEQREEIKRRYQNGEPITSIAASMGVNQATVRRWGIGPGRASDVECEGKDLSYQKNLAWAVDAAGNFLRTGISPTSCPNNAAWFLYLQAIDEPKDFLTKYSQSEKSYVDTNEDNRTSCQKSIEEINKLLSELGCKNE